jgi:AmmeMemoRadiSam system protein A
MGLQYTYTPFTDNELLRTQQLDSKILLAIQQNNLELFRNIITETDATVCGRTPLEILLKLIQQNAFGKTHTDLIAYATSADVSGTTENVVTYASLIVTQEAPPLPLNMQEKNSLVHYARAVLTNALEKDESKKVDPELLTPVLTKNLLEPKGVFITLYTIKDGKRELRGCIGTVLPQKPLYLATEYSVLASAFNDPRFEPVTAEELSTIAIEVSVLTLPRPVDSYKDIVLNKNGIILTQENASALFLPKVPEEFGFTLPQTLEELSKKAGLPADAWQDPRTKFQVFDSLDFGEEALTEISRSV